MMFGERWDEALMFEFTWRERFAIRWQNEECPHWWEDDC
jgi:hypothetical protein